MSNQNPQPNSQIADDLSSLRTVFWIVPFYALAIGFLAAGLALGNYDSVLSVLKKSPVAAYKPIAIVTGLFFIGLAGIAVRSVECALILKTDPFRAFAMGRFILMLYLITNFPLYAISEWPSATIEAPLAAVQGYNDTLVTLDINEAMVTEPNGWWWLAYLADVTCEFFSTFGLVALTFATYRGLLGRNSEYTIDHFVFDITFGWKGEQYC